MSDKNDFRPGALLGKILSEFLIAERYLERPTPKKVVCRKHDPVITPGNGIYLTNCRKCGAQL